jgi:hypothetical protein
MVPMYEKWPLYEPLLPHVTSIHQVFNESSPPINGILQFAELLCNAGTYLFKKGLGNVGLLILKTAEIICNMFAELPEEVTADVFKILLSEPWTKEQSSAMFLAAPNLVSLQANILAYAAEIH